MLVAMPDHLHMILAFHPELIMEETIRNWKRFHAKDGHINWQDGFFDHRIRSSESYNEKARYVIQNPVRAGLCDDARDRPYKWIHPDSGAWFTLEAR